MAATGAADAAAQAAVQRLVDELQEGYDRRDADISNRHFAADLIWGSPFGAIVTGYDELHAIHERLKERGVGGPASRYEIVQALSPAPGVAVAHVRRVALDAQGDPAPEGDGGLLRDGAVRAGPSRRELVAGRRAEHADPAGGGSVADVMRTGLRRGAVQETTRLRRDAAPRGYARPVGVSVTWRHGARA